MNEKEWGLNFSGFTDYRKRAWNVERSQTLLINNKIDWLIATKKFHMAFVFFPDYGYMWMFTRNFYCRHKISIKLNEQKVLAQVLKATIW